MQRCFLNSLSGVQEGEETGPASIHRAPGECLAWAVRIQPVEGPVQHQATCPSGRPALQHVASRVPGPAADLGGRESVESPGPEGPAVVALRGVPAGQRRCLTVTFFQGPSL